MTKSRIDWLFQNLPDSGLDAVVVNPGPSQAYLLGVSFYLFERPVVAFFVPGKKPTLILPELEVSKAQTSGINLQLFPYKENPATWGQVFRQACGYLGLSGANRHLKLGVEADRLRLLEIRLLQEAMPDAHLADAVVLTDLRMRKSADEVAAMRKAVAIAEAGLTASIPLMKIGMTERQLDEEIGHQMQQAGGEGPSGAMVATGPNGANPHHTVSERKLSAGDLVVIDWGARYQGYCSDLTRTLAVGEVDAECQKIAHIAMEANIAGRRAAAPGVPAGEVDKAARAVIEQAGYGPYFTHRTGHGLGTEPHELPYIFAENTLPLAPGMVFTVEPGIYLTGRAGTRVEDDVLITENGAETLSSLPRELVTVG